MPMLLPPPAPLEQAGILTKTVNGNRTYYQADSSACTRLAP